MRKFPTKKKTVKKRNDNKLWKIFSLFIRLRDTNENGYGQCFTCGAFRHYKGGDCGHGVGRQHWGTRYNEKNNHFQCKKCNGFEEGNKAVYSKKVDEIYGKGTWDLLVFQSRQPSKIGMFEIEQMEIYYKQKVEELLKTKTFKL